MIIHFKDRSTLVVTKKQWEQIKQMRSQGKEWIDLKNPVAEFDPSYIWKVEDGGISEADIRPSNDPNKRINQDNRSEEEQEKAAEKMKRKIRAQLKKKGILK